MGTCSYIGSGVISRSALGFLKGEGLMAKKKAKKKVAKKKRCRK